MSEHGNTSPDAKSGGSSSSHGRELEDQIDTFMAVTGVEDRTRASELITEYDGNLEVAVTHVLDGPNAAKRAHARAKAGSSPVASDPSQRDDGSVANVIDRGTATSQAALAAPAGAGGRGGAQGARGASSSSSSARPSTTTGGGSSVLKLVLWPIDALLTVVLYPIIKSVLFLLPRHISEFLILGLPFLRAGPPRSAPSDKRTKSSTAKTSIPTAFPLQIKNDKESKVATLTLLKLLKAIGSAKAAHGKTSKGKEPQQTANVDNKENESSEANSSSEPSSRQDAFEFPVFKRAGYLESARECTTKLEYLVVYLHCDARGSKVKNFVTTELPKIGQELNKINSSTAVVAAGKPPMKIWCADVLRSSQGAELADTLGCTTYPFFAVLIPDPSSSGIKLSIAARCVAPHKSQDVLSVLQRVRSHFDPKLSQRRVDDREREMARRIRDDQNSAYERSLQADREKALVKQQEEAQKLQELKSQQEQERIKQQEIELKQQQLESIKKIAPEEPEKTDPDYIAIRFQLPTGKRVTRGFLKTHTIGEAYAYVLTLPEEDVSATFDDPLSDILLVNSYPRKVFDNESITLEDAGFARGGVIIVEEDV